MLAKTRSCNSAASLSIAPLGPWFVGEIIDGKWGCCFSFGIVVDGHFLQGGLTFISGIIQVRGPQKSIRALSD